MGNDSSLPLEYQTGEATGGGRETVAVLSVAGVSLGFGGPPLLDRADLQIERGERVCLVGRNGVGKSTLMKLVNGEIRAEVGEVLRGKHVRVARLPQDIPQGLGDTV